MRVVPRLVRKLLGSVHSGSRTSYIAYLQAAAADPAIESLRARALPRLALHAGDRVLDVGCGPGTITTRMANLVGNAGHVIGIDVDPQMLAAADAAVARAGFKNVVHRLDDCSALSLESDFFDGCYCERVFQHLAGQRPLQAAVEILRVLKAGGRFVLVDTDWCSIEFRDVEPQLGAQVKAAWLRGFANPGSGSQLLGLITEAGAVDLHVEATTLTVSPDGSTAALLTQTAANALCQEVTAAWGHHVERSRQAHTPLAEVAMIAVSGAR